MRPREERCSVPKIQAQDVSGVTDHLPTATDALVHQNTQQKNDTTKYSEQQIDVELTAEQNIPVVRNYT